MKTRITLVVIAILMAVSAIAQDNPQAVDQGNSPETLAILKGSFRAGAEARYQQDMAREYASATQLWSRGSLILSLVGFIASPLFARHKRDAIATIAFLVGLGSLAFSIKSDDSKASVRYIDHVVLEKRWQELRNQWDHLEQRQDDISEQELKANILTLMAQQASLQSADPPETNEQAWDAAWVREAEVRKLPVPPKPGAAKPVSGEFQVSET